MSTSPQQNPKDTTQIIDQHDLEDFETTNESLGKVQTLDKKSSMGMHQVNQSEEISRLREKIKWLEDALKKKDKLNEETYNENQLLKKELADKSIKSSESEKSEKEQLKAEIFALKDANAKEIKEKEGLRSEIQVLKDSSFQKLEEFNQIKKQLTAENLSLTDSLTKNRNESDLLNKKLIMLEETIKLKEASLLFERQKLEDLTRVLEKGDRRTLEEAKALEGDSKAVIEKKQEENAGFFFLNPIMRIVLYLLLAVYVSFYIGCDRLQSLFRKNKANWILSKGIMI